MPGLGCNIQARAKPYGNPVLKEASDTELSLFKIFCLAWSFFVFILIFEDSVLNITYFDY